MAFCRFCGNEVAEGETCACRVKSNGAGSKTVIIAAAAAAVVVIALIVILIVSIGGSGYKKVLSDYKTAIMEADIEAWYRTAFTDDMMETYEEEYIDRYYDDSDEFWDEESEELEELLEGLEDEFGKNIKIKISVVDKEALDEDDIEEIEDDYKDEFDCKVKIEKAYELECNILVKGKDDSDDDDVDVIVFKTKDEGWKIHIDSVDEINDCMYDMAE